MQAEKNKRVDKINETRLRQPNSLAKQLISFATNKGLLAIHLVVNGKLITLLHDQYGASSAVLAISTQSIFLGIGAGMLLREAPEITWTFGRQIGSQFGFSD